MAGFSALILSSLIAALTLRFLWLRFQTGFGSVNYDSYVVSSVTAFRHAVLPTLVVGILLFALWEGLLSTRPWKSRFVSRAAALTLFFAAMTAYGLLWQPGAAFPGETWPVAWLICLAALAASEAAHRLDTEMAQRVVYSRPTQVLIDALVVGSAFFVAYLIRFDGSLSDRFLRQFLTFVVGMIVLQIAVNYLWGVHRFIWRFTSLKEAIVIGQSVASAALVAIVFRLVFLHQFEGLRVPLGVLLIHPMLTYVGLLGVRVARRVQYRRQIRGKPEEGHGSPKRLLLVGAGHAGQSLVREIERDPHFRIVGFLDDDPRKIGRVIHGVPVLGPVDSLAEMVAGSKIDEVTLSMPTAPISLLRSIAARCEEVGVSLSSIPSLSEILLGKVALSRLRPVRMEDLLGRASIEYAIDDEQLLQHYRGRRILITGAAGSIGSELVRQLKEFGPSQLILLDKDENGLYEVGLETRLGFEEQTREVIADVRDLNRLRSVFSRHRPEVVFHAAAYKHVPLMECHPCEAVRNNVMGTRNLVDLAAEFAVRAFVLVSTDKAVNPTNVMGASKRIAESIVQRRASRNPSTRFCCVRFGNVLGSRASVVPLFQEQIRKGRNITVTHPDVQRYFMTIPEAVQLVIQAGSLGSRGEIFVLDMGDPVKIVDLAKDLIQLSGLALGRDIEIEFTGLRPGEKLFEELLLGEEDGVRDTKYPKIFVAQAIQSNWPLLDTHLNLLEAAAKKDDDDEVREILAFMDIGYRQAELGLAREP